MKGITSTCYSLLGQKTPLRHQRNRIPPQKNDDSSAQRCIMCPTGTYRAYTLKGGAQCKQNERVHALPL